MNVAWAGRETHPQLGSLALWGGLLTAHSLGAQAEGKQLWWYTCDSPPQGGKPTLSASLRNYIPRPHFVHCTATSKPARMHVVRAGGSERRMAAD